MHQCPGCLSLIYIKVRPNKTPVPYTVDSEGNKTKHKCKKLQVLQKEIENMEIVIDHKLLNDLGLGG